MVCAASCVYTLVTSYAKEGRNPDPAQVIENLTAYATRI